FEYPRYILPMCVWRPFFRLTSQLHLLITQKNPVTNLLSNRQNSDPRRRFFRDVIVHSKRTNTKFPRGNRVGPHRLSVPCFKGRILKGSVTDLKLRRLVKQRA